MNADTRDSEVQRIRNALEAYQSAHGEIPRNGTRCSALWKIFTDLVVKFGESERGSKDE